MHLSYFQKQLKLRLIFAVFTAPLLFSSYSEPVLGYPILASIGISLHGLGRHFGLHYDDRIKL